MPAFGRSRTPGSQTPLNGALSHGAPTAPGAVRAVLFSPLTWILFLAGLFDGMADNWVHALVLWAAAFVVARDKVHAAHGLVDPATAATFRAPGRPSVRLVAVLVVVAVAYSVVAGSFDRYTWPVTAAVVLPGVLVLASAWPGPLWPRPVPPRPRALGATLWAGLLVATGLWELTALLLQPNLRDGSYDHPTISYLMDTVLATSTGRALTLLAWLGLGAFLLTRCSGDSTPARAEEEP